jgi:Flp pilus assembly protein TadD
VYSAGSSPPRADPAPVERDDAPRIAGNGAREDGAGAAAARALALSSLERGEAEPAVAILRRALYFSTDDALTRHLHAIALWESGDRRGALRQLDRLTAALRAKPEEERLSDGVTSAGDLLRGSTFLGRQWR